jgi:hypothetical protein
MKGPVFLSYARGDAQGLANRLREALKAAGVAVWQDVERIVGGPWAHQIERALGEAEAMLALLTPCAVGRGGPDCARESDSVCLDEIAFARFAPRPVPIVPVMVRSCQPPLVLYRLHYHDFTRVDDELGFTAALESVKKDLARAAAGLPHYRSFVDRLAPLDFESFLGPKRRGFVGRDWLFARVTAFLGRPEKRVLLIEGQAGVGKSSFLAEMIHRNPDGAVIAYHCCQADTPATLSPAEFVRTMASMIASQHPDYAAELDSPAVGDRLARDAVELDPASAFEQGVLAPLARLPPQDGRVRVLAIDALDEALLRPPPAAGGPPPLTVVDLLSTRVDRFPPWLKVVATTRPERPVKQRLAFEAEVISAEDPLNRKDLETFVRVRLDDATLRDRVEASGQPIDDVVAQLTTLAAGNFLYASQVLDEVAEDAYHFTDIDKLPPTLRQKYAWFLNRQFPTEKSFAPLREVLELLVAAEVALPLGDLATGLGCAPKDLAPRLSRLASFIRTEPGADPAYGIYHKSMTEWLTDPARSDEIHSVRPLYGHVRLADRFWSVFTSRGAAALSRYAVTHLPAHLAACADGATEEGERSTRLEQLVRLVRSEGVQTHRFQRPALVSDALRLALERSARAAEGRCVRLLFQAAWSLLAFRRSRLRPDRMFQLAVDGDLDAFSSELSAYPADPTFRDLASLLGAWLARDRFPDAALAFRKRLQLAPQTDQSLILRVDAALAGQPSPLSTPPDVVVHEHEVRQMLAEVGGADLEGTSGYQPRPVSPGYLEPSRGGGDEMPVFLSELHGPRLVAFAVADPSRGRGLMLDYVALQASNQYPVYRDLALYKLVPSIVSHPDDDWTRAMLRELATAALAGAEREFAEPALLACQALVARATDGARFQARLAEIADRARTPGPGGERSDLWGDHRRRFGAAGEALVQALGGDASALLEHARTLPRGYSGMEAYARLTLAESLHVCARPPAEIEAELAEAEASAHNIQDASFCALTTARCTTLRARWWSAVLDGDPLDLEGEIDHLERGLSPAQWAIGHQVGHLYPARRYDRSSQPLPGWMLGARSLSEIARVYQVSVEELRALNPDLGDVTAPLAEGRLVQIPDPGFRPLIAAFLSALALVAPNLEDGQRVHLIQRLVPAALAKPTALHTVLGRLALAAGRAGLIDPVPLGEEAADYVRQVERPEGPGGRGLRRGLIT